jgi:hypothetical protein
MTNETTNKCQKDYGTHPFRPFKCVERGRRGDLIGGKSRAEQVPATRRTEMRLVAVGENRKRFSILPDRAKIKFDSRLFLAIAFDKFYEMQFGQPG